MFREERQKTGWRELVAAGLYQTGALRALEGLSRSYELRRDAKRSVLPRWRRVSTAKFAILCYHRIGTGGIPLYSSLPPEVFEAQMRFLRKRYEIVSLTELCERLADPGAKGQAVAVTFDDGYRDLYTQALPVLRAYQVPATIYLTVGAIETGQVSWYDRVFLALQVCPGDTLHLELDKPCRFELPSPAARFRAALEIVGSMRRLPDERRRECCAALERHIPLPPEEMVDRMLTWDQIQTMQRAGLAFGSHSLTHPVLSRVAPARMESELRKSKQVLEERIGQPVKDFAYPFGQRADCGALAGEPFARLGYRSAATTIWGINRGGANPYALRRVQIGEERSLSMFAFRLNQLLLEADDEAHRPEPAESPSEKDEGRCHRRGLVQ